MKHRTGYLVKRGGIYYVQWTVAGRKFKKTTGTGNRRDAERFQAKFMEPFAVGDETTVLKSVAAKLDDKAAELAQIEDERNPPVKLKDAWGAYLKAGNRKEISRGTQANYEGYWTAFATWMGKAHADANTLRDVTFRHAEGYIASLAETKVTGRTINAHRAFLRAFWNVLADRARLEGNPWAKIAKRDEHSLGRRALTVEELRRVCGAATGELRVLLALGLYLGARLGDCATMDWGCVDMLRRVVRYTPRKTARKAPAPLIVPMHPELHAVLAETPPELRKGPVCPDLAGRYARRGADGVSDLVQKHFTDCGLATTAERTGSGVRKSVAVGFHSMRHTAVSLLREAGAAQSVSQALVGHNSPEVHALYTHTDETAMRRAVGTIPGVLGIDTEEDSPVEELKARVLKIAKKLSAGSLDAVVKELQALPQPDPLEALKAKVAELAGALEGKTLKSVKKGLLALAEPKKKVPAPVVALPSPVVER